MPEEFQGGYGSPPVSRGGRGEDPNRGSGNREGSPNGRRPGGKAGDSGERPIDPDTGKPYRDREWRGKTLFEEERGTKLYPKESQNQGGDFIDVEKQTYDFLGPLDPDTPHNITEVLESLKAHVRTLKADGVDFVVVDFRGFRDDVVAGMSAYLDSLPRDLRARV